MTKKILGISAYYHDSAAAIIEDGKIIAAAQEERFSRNKHDPNFPAQAIQFCLDDTNCNLEQLDAIIFYDKPLLKFERLLETYFANAPFGIRSFIRAMPIWLKEKLYLKSILRRELRNLAGLDKKAKLPTLLFSEHHLSHAGSAFFPSPYEEAAVLCLDGVGEWATSTAWSGKENKLSPIWEIQFPHSLGLLYSAFTYYCGFRVNSGEYKLMGLAPYGEPVYVDKILDKLINVHDDGSFDLDMSYFDYAVGDRMTNSKFDKLFGGPARLSDSEVSQKEMDLARSIQVVTEEIVLKIAKHLYTLVPSKNLCLAGGVALNCVANGRLLRDGPYENIWIQPAAGDAGGALGAALVAWHHYFEQPRLIDSSNDAMFGSYLGPSYSNEQINAEVEKQKLVANSISNENLYDHVAKLVEQGNVIGWFQGRMEFGPRALGNRSIIGDPRNVAMQSTMNLKIKYRESFRPFAPAVLATDVAKYFDHDVESPYMLFVADIKSELKLKTDNALFGIDKLNQKRSTLPAITHVDYSARIQTVHEDTNPEFHNLLSSFKAKTGCGVLVNTSFNVRGEPPVCSPKDAIRCFLATEMDYLVMNNIVLAKTDQPQSAIDVAKSIKFDMD
ncbi:carbamoyltransferase [Psychrosphaera sp. B3R10]|uniref:carbamoyltransferase family protein n=1 Tax=unclassified Psychrosphaera TaxID=2641570 RepID=UPI001C089FD0|nr:MULTISPECIES: carbamoyltransferase [unclassified Psychrosphaera]MBU2881389.1 carbamoyltransferase [Psychrosphaera sp. I2R16]MBU2989599.1 carbamoyltransferase [Psychrosphaera sp. B3R10]